MQQWVVVGWFVARLTSWYMHPTFVHRTLVLIMEIYVVAPEVLRLCVCVCDVHIWICSRLANNVLGVFPCDARCTYSYAYAYAVLVIIWCFGACFAGRICTVNCMASLSARWARSVFPSCRVKCYMLLVFRAPTWSPFMCTCLGIAQTVGGVCRLNLRF